jgi:hypothetical protein
MIRIISVLLVLASVRDSVAPPPGRQPLWVQAPPVWRLTLEDVGKIIVTAWSPTSSCVAAATETTIHVIDSKGHPLWKWRFQETNRLIHVNGLDRALAVSPMCDVLVVGGGADYKYVWAANQRGTHTFFKTVGTPLSAKFDLRGDTIAVVTGASLGYLLTPRLNVRWSGQMGDLPIKWRSQELDPSGTPAAEFAREDVDTLFGALLWGRGVSDSVSDDGQWRAVVEYPFRGAGTGSIKLWGPGAGGYRRRQKTTVDGSQPRWIKTMGCPSADLTRDGEFVIATGDPDHPDAFKVGDSPACDAGDVSTYVFDRDGNTVLTWPHGGNSDEMSEAVFRQTGKRLAFLKSVPSWDVSLDADEASRGPERERRFSPDGRMLLTSRDRELRLYRAPE